MPTSYWVATPAANKNISIFGGTLIPLGNICNVWGPLWIKFFLCRGSICRVWRPSLELHCDKHSQCYLFNLKADLCICKYWLNHWKLEILGGKISSFKTSEWINHISDSKSDPVYHHLVLKPVINFAFIPCCINQTALLWESLLIG